jgi:hypothetical protein
VTRNKETNGAFDTALAILFDNVSSSPQKGSAGQDE